MPVMQISTLPRGLLSLLGLQNFGEGPRFLSDQFVGVVNTFDMFCVTARSTLSTAAVAANAVNTFPFPELLVPAGELWWLQNYTVRAVLAAAQTIRIRPNYSENSLTTVDLGPAAAAIANEQVRAPSQAPQFIVGGGQLGCTVESISGGPINLTAAAIISRFRV